MKKQLASNDYYSLEANKKYFSVSQLKDFMKCEAMAMAKIRGEYSQPTTRAMLTGSFVDAYFEGTLPEFMKCHPEIYTQKNALRADFKLSLIHICGEPRVRIVTEFYSCQYDGGGRERIPLEI